MGGWRRFTAHHTCFFLLLVANHILLRRLIARVALRICYMRKCASQLYVLYTTHHIVKIVKIYFYCAFYACFCLWMCVCVRDTFAWRGCEFLSRRICNIPRSGLHKKKNEMASTHAINDEAYWLVNESKNRSNVIYPERSVLKLVFFK